MGHKIDMELSQIRAAFYAEDFEGARERIERAQKLFGEGGGDWERKNRLKVYEGLFHMMCRRFGKAAELLLDSLATFTSTELLPHETFVLYTVVTAKIPNAHALLNAYYECRYLDFMVAFADLIDE